MLGSAVGFSSEELFMIYGLHVHILRPCSILQSVGESNCVPLSQHRSSSYVRVPIPLHSSTFHCIIMTCKVFIDSEEEESTRISIYIYIYILIYLIAMLLIIR